MPATTAADTPLAAAPRPWTPAPAFRVTAFMHAAGAAALAASPPDWPWVVAGLAANHAVLGIGCLAPRSRLLGANLTRLPPAARARGEVALTFDDGPDPDVTPRILDLLDRAGAKASFFMIGEHASRHRALSHEICRRGHAVENHSHRHSTAFGWYGLARTRQEIETAQAAIATATGVAPAFFRAPFGMRNPLLEPALSRVGLHYASWTRRGLDTIARNPGAVLARLTRRLAAGDILLLHDRTGTQTLAVLPDLLAALANRGLRSVTLRTACADGFGA